MAFKFMKYHLSLWSQHIYYEKISRIQAQLEVPHSEIQVELD